MKKMMSDPQSSTSIEKWNRDPDSLCQKPLVQSNNERQLLSHRIETLSAERTSFEQLTAES